MSLISIVGTSGVGKSFLVKQLAALNCMPAFFEGEEGVIPNEMFDGIFSDEDPVGRFDYFIDRYKANLNHARQVSNAGLDVYVDGANISTQAISFNEDEKYREILQKKVDIIKDNASDLIVLVTASSEKIRQMITDRGRASEKSMNAYSRAIKIQNIFLKLVEGRDDVIVLDRTNLRFENEKDLRMIDGLIKQRLGK